jgi:hypothetical protein
MEIATANCAGFTDRSASETHLITHDSVTEVCESEVPELRSQAAKTVVARLYSEPSAGVPDDPDGGAKGCAIA